MANRRDYAHTIITYDRSTEWKSSTTAGALNSRTEEQPGLEGISPTPLAEQAHLKQVTQQRLQKDRDTSRREADAGFPRAPLASLPRAAALLHRPSTRRPLFPGRGPGNAEETPRRPPRRHTAPARRNSPRELTRSSSMSAGGAAGPAGAAGLGCAPGTGMRSWRRRSRGISPAPPRAHWACARLRARRRSGPRVRVPALVWE